jgi:Transglycosylase SLT domain
VNGSLALVAAPLALVLLIGGGMSVEAEQQATYVVDVDALPPLARELLEDVEAIRAHSCPELPLVWLVAQVQVESNWDPLAYSTAGAAGLLQMLPGSWTEAGGASAWGRGRPSADHPVWRPLAHLAVALPWMCAHLRQMAEYLSETGKPTSPLDALAVCHIAGCSRVTGSATGIPVPGEAGCDYDCVGQVTDYVSSIHGWVERYLKATTAVAAPAGTAVPLPGATSGCPLSDPTGTGGCVTEAAAWMLVQTASAFPGLPVTCWDAHAWNPDSDHPKGRACDFTIGRSGSFPNGDDVARGWAIAEWLRANAASLHVSYLIWQGRIWSVSRADQGWRAYTGGGVYDPTDPTGGHYDHIHVSVSQ